MREIFSVLNDVEHIVNTVLSVSDDASAELPEKQAV